MRQVWITGHGGPSKLVLREAPDPQPVGSELRVRVKASGINFADILARLGLYPDAPRPPMVVGYEISGVVDAVGPDASREWIGKEVFGLVRFGGYSDCVVVPAGQVFEKPAPLSHEQCAALPVQYLTAWQLLVVMGSLSPDETVLIHNAGGGVGLAAIDIARHIGATIYGTASVGKHAFLRSHGVHEAIDYVHADWTREVLRLTEGRGVELIIDPLGGRHWKRSLGALRHTGRLGMFGVSTATQSSPAGPAPAGENRVEHAAVQSRDAHEQEPIGVRRQPRPSLARDGQAEVVDAVRCFGVSRRDGYARTWTERSRWNTLREAHSYIEARRNIGKVVLVP